MRQIAPSVVVATLGLLTGQARADIVCGGSLLTPTVAQSQPSFVVQASCLSVDHTTIVVRTAAGREIATRIVSSYAGQPDSQWLVEPVAPLAPGDYEVDVVGSMAPLLPGAAPNGPFRAQLADRKLTVVKPSREALAWARVPAVTAQVHTATRQGLTIELGATAATVAFVELVDDVSKRRQQGYVAVRGTSIEVGSEAMPIGINLAAQGMFGLVNGRGYAMSITLLAPHAPASSAVRQLAVRYAP